MKYNNCPYCKTVVTPELINCPACGRKLQQNKLHIILLTIVSGCLMLAAVSSGLMLDASNRRPVEEKPIPTMEIIETAEPTPPPTPTVEFIRLYAFGREIDSDGFTAYVGDKPITLTVEVEPAVKQPNISWSICDSRNSNESAAFSVSGDTMSCEFTAVKPTGRNEMTIRCYGTEIIIPVFLWEH